MTLAKSHENSATIIAFETIKGGPGKTSTSVNVAACMAQKGKRVLLIDNDPQGNGSDYLGIEHPEYTISDVYNGTFDIESCIQTVEYTFNRNTYTMDVIPTDGTLAQVNKILNESTVSGQREILRNALQRVVHLYDYIVIDCNPSQNMLIENALVASHTVVVPMVMEKFPVKGYKLVNEEVLNARDLNPDLYVSAIIAVRYKPSYGIHKDYLEFVRSNDPYRELLIDTPIREAAVVPNSQFDSTPVAFYAPSSKTGRDYHKVTDMLIERLEG
jgi:chromosome partitioning protein